MFELFKQTNMIKTIDIIKHTNIFSVVDMGENDINYFFINYVSNGNWEEHTFIIFDKYKSKNKVMLDIGGWIGVTPMYCSFNYKSVYAFEIDNEALKRFKLNVSVNPQMNNIHIIEKGISSFSGKGKLSTKGQFGDSESLVLDLQQDTDTLNEKNVIEVDLITIEDAIKEYNIPVNNIGLIKMDIEGAESNVIPAMKNFLITYKPPLYLSIHHHLIKPNKMDEILSILFDIYPSRKVYNMKGESMQVTKKILMDNKLIDCVFSNEFTYV
jgi:FkbM family methyltransferase